MKRHPILGILVAISFVGILSQNAYAGGREIFLQQKCHKCHRVSAEKIDPIKEGTNIVDLAGVGSKFDKEFLTQWLKKETKKESILKKGKQVVHKRKKWTDSEEDLAVLVDWLSTLKDKQ